MPRAGLAEPPETVQERAVTVTRLYGAAFPQILRVFMLVGAVPRVEPQAAALAAGLVPAAPEAAAAEAEAAEA